jgi:hypothetical protein
MPARNGCIKRVAVCQLGNTLASGEGGHSMRILLQALHALAAKRGDGLLPEFLPLNVRWTRWQSRSTRVRHSIKRKSRKGEVLEYKNMKAPRDGYGALMGAGSLPGGRSSVRRGIFKPIDGSRPSASQQYGLRPAACQSEFSPVGDTIDDPPVFCDLLPAALNRIVLLQARL